ncbi:NlpC/P60 family protein [Marinactinospora rubrisoli]|uniref:NlpC/P60 family protein n=1 Tax=Marinactinospora rubrisoli TaxID=2715399 RepID=A0ABW2KQV0_9ACTN
MLRLIKILFSSILGMALGVTVLVTTLLGSSSASGVPAQVEGIPDVLLDAYDRAAASTEQVRPGCTGMRWSILAGIGKVESNHLADLGSDIEPNGDIDPPLYGPTLNGDGFAAIPDTDNGELDGDATWDRAVGPMQFIPSSWETYGQDGNGDGVKDPQNVYDATLATAAHLCGEGPRDFSDREQVREAVHAYNPGGGSSPDDNQYVADVMQAVDGYDALQATPADYDGSAHPAAAVAISWARQQVGTPYVWGGTCTDPQMSPASTNCDCSSLAQIAYRQAGISLQRTTTTQWYGQSGEMLQIPALSHGQLTNADLARLQPGDLLYFDTSAPGGLPSHMGIYLGGTQMIHAPNSRETVKIVDIMTEKGGYYAGVYRGAMRPWEPA